MARASFRVALMIASLIASSRSFPQISPGPLSKAHASLEGSANCLKCHASRSGTMGAACLDCHKEIAWLTARERGFHARKTAEDCAGCHPEHAGADFALIEWPGGSRDGFDHSLAGWPLVDSHAPLKCAACHAPEKRKGPAAKLAPGGGSAARWTGLERDCVSCHADPHRGNLDLDCAKCHDQKKFKPASRFDHAKTAYALTGDHIEVPCVKCHTGEANVFPPLEHAECAACHKDPHAGRLGPKCSTCHVTTDFKTVSRDAFDHDRTRYPLKGLHRTVACAACHDPRKPGSEKPRFDRCDACHADAHAGAATPASPRLDCAECHSTSSFEQSTFTASRHATTRYPLLGRHATAACEKCHVKNPPAAPRGSLGTSGVLLRPASARCSDCHADAHGGQLLARPDKGACEGCHTVERFKPSQYTAKEHALTTFPLRGRHATADCGTCHAPERKGLPPIPDLAKAGPAKKVFKLPAGACTECHADPHTRDAAGRFDFKRCSDCHGEDVFAPSLVDSKAHARFSFPLEGAHRAVPCVDCHADLKAPRAASSLLLAASARRSLPFVTKKTACADCHETPHGRQFDRRPDKGACSACHGTDSFRVTDFDHTRASGFSLEGAHVRVRCAECHPSRAESGAAGKLVTIYSPVPRDCAGCHSGGPPA